MVAGLNEATAPYRDDAPAEQSILAFVSDDGSKVAWVFGPGEFSAVRSLEGDWRSPAPKVKAGDFVSDGGYDRLPDAAALALSEEAREATKKARGRDF